MRIFASSLLALAALAVAVPAQAAPPRGLLAPPPGADSAKPAPPKPLTMDDLFRRLQSARSAPVADRWASEIQARWMKSGSDTVDLLLERAVAAMADKNPALALDILDSAIALKPDYAEAWNQRAVVHYTRREFDAAIEDVEVALRLEPRHFGALVGMATLLGQFGYSERALAAYRKALEIHPFLKDVPKRVEELSLEVEGRKS